VLFPQEVHFVPSNMGLSDGQGFFGNFADLYALSALAMVLLPISIKFPASFNAVALLYIIGALQFKFFKSYNE
jgi:hypothetical protein